MKEKWEKTKEKWERIKESKFVRVAGFILALICTFGPSLIGFFSEDEPEPLSSLEQADAILQDEERMDAIWAAGNRAKAVNGSTVEIYLADDDDLSTGITGIIVDMTQDDVLIATVYNVVQNQNSIGVRFFDKDCVEAQILRVNEEINIAILAVSKDSLPIDIQDIIIPNVLSSRIKKGTTIYGYNRGATEDSYSKIVEITDAKYEFTMTNGEEIKLIEVQMEEDADVVNRIFYTEDSEVIGMSVPGIGDESQEGYAYIVPMEVILQIAGIESER